MAPLITPAFASGARPGVLDSPSVFGGHHAVGGGCRSIALIDPIPCILIQAPSFIAEDSSAVRSLDAVAISCRINSRLLILHTNCASYFYEWTGRALKLIRKIPATMEKR